MLACFGRSITAFIIALAPRQKLVTIRSSWWVVVFWRTSFQGRRSDLDPARCGVRGCRGDRVEQRLRVTGDDAVPGGAARAVVVVVQLLLQRRRVSGEEVRRGERRRRVRLAARVGAHQDAHAAAELGREPGRSKRTVSA